MQSASPIEPQKSFAQRQARTPEPPTELGFWRTARTNSKLRRHSPPIQAVPRDQPLPLSHNQQRLWNLEQLHPARSVQNLLHTFHLSGTLNHAALQESLQTIIQRHEILRTRFATPDGLDGQVVQSIEPTVALNLPIIDLQPLPPEQQRLALQQLSLAQADQPFDLSHCPLWRFQLLQLSPTEHVLIRTIHHIIFDGWSHTVFLRELGLLYGALAAGAASPLLELPVQYADFAHTEREWLKDENLSLRLDYWQQQLSGAVAAVELPIDHPRSGMTSYEGACQSFVLSPEVSQGLKALSYQAGVSLFVTLFSAFNLLLHCYSQQRDLLVCTPVAGRHRAETKGMIGYFNNLLVLRTLLSSQMSVREVLQQVSQVSLQAYEYQDLPLQRVAELANLARVPLTRAMFVLQNTPNPSLELGELQVRSEFVIRAIADFEISLSMQEQSGQLEGALQYKTALFNSQTIADLLQHFEQLLKQLINHPEQRLAELPKFRNSTDSIHYSEQKNDTVGRPAYVSPRNELEQQLAQIWEEVLGVSPIGIHDNFFELGGQSLSAVKMWVQIEERLNKKLPISALLQSQTVEGIANLLHTHAEETVEDLVPLRSSGTKPPLFCIYGIWLYRELVEQLDPDQPVYGVYIQEEVDILKSNNAAQQSSVLSSVSSIANRYLQAIRKLQPHGPYYLAGESFGGTVALEIAQQLQDAGEAVALVALLDSMMPATLSHLTLANRLKLHGQLLLKQGLPYILKAAQQRMQKLRQSVSVRFFQVYQKLNSSVHSNLQQTTLNDIRQDVRARALQAYSPQPYSGKVLLFRAMERDPFEIDLNHDLGWGQFIEDLQVFDVPGDHLGILQKPHVQIMADILQAHIDATCNAPCESTRKNQHYLREISGFEDTKMCS
ncbi:condensation domain-containing protein [Egbenema bharatensis]|uniref:condensation domain-containing protein n=1 Tax=Egbenema bharatensis TaxID=3463334 RepID=UPI003A86800F